MYYELSKSEKKLARQIIDKGLQIEYKNGILKMDKIITVFKKKMPDDNRETYFLLYKTLINHDKHIGNRYDLRGSKYIFILAGQLADKIITRDELNVFCSETLQRILFLSGEDQLEESENEGNEE